MSVLSALRNWFAAGRERELAERLEEQLHFTSLEARVFVDHRLEAIEHRLAVSREELERSSLLAVQEAKAYADEAATSLGMSLRGVSQAVLEASRKSAAASGADQPAYLKLSLRQRLDRLGNDLRNTAEGGSMDPAVRETIARLGQTIGNLTTGMDAVAVATRDIETIVASLKHRSTGDDNAADGGEA